MTGAATAGASGTPSTDGARHGRRDRDHHARHDRRDRSTPTAATTRRRGRRRRAPSTGPATRCRRRSVNEIGRERPGLLGPVPTSAVSRPATRPDAALQRGGASLAAMDLTLTPAQLELQARARAFVRDVLQPREVEFERAGGRVAARLGRPDPARRRSRPGCTAARSRSRPAGRAGRSSSRSSSTSSSASRPAGCGRTSRAPTTSLVHADAGAAPALPRAVACAASARGATRSPRTAPAPTRGPCARPPSATRRPASTSSTARSGSSPARTTPTS